MRISRAWPVIALLLLAGCEDVVDTVKGPMSFRAPDQRKTEQTFAADSAATYAAAKAALRQMGFHYTHGGPAQGELDAMSDVTAGALHGAAEQYVLRAHFQPSLDGKSTLVRLELTEVEEDDSLHHPGEGTESVLRDSSLYGAFFGYIQQQLGSGTAP